MLLEVVRKFIIIRVSLGCSARALLHVVTCREVTRTDRRAEHRSIAGGNIGYVLLCALLYSRLMEHMKGSNSSCFYKTLISEFTSPHSWKLKAGIIQKLYRVGYGLDDRGIGFDSGPIFSSPQRPGQHSGSHPAFYRMDAGGCLPGGEAAEA